MCLYTHTVRCPRRLLLLLLLQPVLQQHTEITMYLTRSSSGVLRADRAWSLLLPPLRRVSIHDHMRL